MQVVIVVMHALISIHALLAESDGATTSDPGANNQHFYPRSPCGERRPPAPPRREFYKISIHALLAESDKINPANQTNLPDFYPRSPCGERLWPGLLARPFFIISIHALLAESDITQFLRLHPKYPFLSTLSLRRATEFRKLLYPGSTNFYPRSPCGERHQYKNCE